MAEQYKAEQIINAITKTRGNKAAAARALKCSRNTIDRYIATYATVREAYDEVNETTLDVSESLLTQFMEGRIEKQTTREQLDALKFYLRTKGKERGYTERSEVTGKDGGPFQVEGVDFRP